MKTILAVTLAIETTLGILWGIIHQAPQQVKT